MTSVVPSVIRPASAEELADAVREHVSLQLVGAGTKTALTAPRGDAVRCELTGISGVVDHQPSEFLITARGGTPIRDLLPVLDEHGQYFPFDPPLVDCGATIGGTVAAGLSGPGRLRYGGIRDFIMGIRLVDGLGNLVTAGGRVVKNAAGYDIPKLMVGSCGYLGAIVEVTLKVFPRPAREETLKITLDNFAAAVRMQNLLARSPIELTALDLEPEKTLIVRIGGRPEAVTQSASRLERFVREQDKTAKVTRVDPQEARPRPWLDGDLPATDRLVRVPLAPAKIEAVEMSLAEALVPRRYSVAGNLVWLRWPASRPLAQLDDLLRYHDLGGTVLVGTASRTRIGYRGDLGMVARIKQALDPDHKFVGSP